MCVMVLGSMKDKAMQENERLKKSNSVLLQTLKELAVGQFASEWECYRYTTTQRNERSSGTPERTVCESVYGNIYTGGANTNHPGCGGCWCCSPKNSNAAVGVVGQCTLAERKSCNGPKQKLTHYNRLPGATVARFGEGTPEGCLGSCEYFGLDGCCQWDLDTQECWFSRTGSTYQDDHGKRVMTSGFGEWPVTYGMVYWRESGYCRWSGPLKWVEVSRPRACEWNGDDKAGRREKRGVKSAKECQDFSMQFEDTVWAQLKDGLCRTYRTCSYDHPWYSEDGWQTWQKINTDAHVID